MAKDLFDEDEVVVGRLYGWYNIAGQRFCGKFRGIKGTAKGMVLLMEYKREIIEIKEHAGRFPMALQKFKTHKRNPREDCLVEPGGWDDLNPLVEQAYRRGYF